MNQTGNEHAIIRRLHDLTRLGIPCIPLIGLNRFISWRAPIVHRHDHCHEIILCVNGSCTYIVNGREYALNPGDVLAIPPDTDHFIREYPKGLRTCYLLFRTNRRTVLGLAQDEADWLRRQLHELPVRFNASGCRLGDHFDRILRLAEQPHPDLGYRIALRTAVTDLLLVILNAATRTNLQPTNQRLQALIMKMEQHPEEDYPLPALAREYGLSVNALLAQFRKLAGDTPHAYLLRCRIERAKELLRGNAVAVVARQLGFPSPQHFATQFKRLTGHTPREFRR